MRKFEKWCKFSSYIETKSCKKKLCKMRPVCVQLCFLFESILRCW